MNDKPINNYVDLEDLRDGAGKRKKKKGLKQRKKEEEVFKAKNIEELNVEPKSEKKLLDDEEK